MRLQNGASSQTRSSRLAAHIASKSGDNGVTARQNERTSVAPAKPPIAANTVKSISETDVFLAGYRSKQQERQRIRDVFSAEATRGKERTALRLLAEEDIGADEIIGRLKKCATEQEKREFVAQAQAEIFVEEWVEAHNSAFAQRNPTANHLQPVKRG